jgi:hypothetical protein
MYGCLQSSVFNMTADIYYQIESQDPSTNEIDRRWSLLKNISCTINPIRESGGSATSDNKYFSKEYTEDLETKMYSMEQLSKRWRVSGIKNNSGTALYKEIDRISSPDTIFEVYASHPILDIFGNIQYYENHLRRTTVQSND